MIGVIGGTGLYSVDGMKIRERREVPTPYGKPSAPVMLGSAEGVDVAFLPRHGLHHDLLPTEINYRANIWALKEAGVRQILAVSATGSLVEEIRPGDIALASQYIDLTKGKRSPSFFGQGMAAHISSAEPTCTRLGKAIQAVGKEKKISLHSGKTYACVEGPRLGTRAESFMLRGFGAHLVGMTNVPESFLAREAQLCYCTIAIATDYDCWMDDPSQHVTVDQVMKMYKEKIGTVTKLLFGIIAAKPDFTSCSCRKALEFAVMTPEASISPDNRKIIDFLRA